MTAVLLTPEQDVDTFLSLFGVWEIKETNVGKVLANIKNQTFKCCEKETCMDKWVASKKNRTRDK